jgi:hypothetical protein
MHFVKKELVIKFRSRRAGEVEEQEDKASSKLQNQIICFTSYILPL